MNLTVVMVSLAHDLAFLFGSVVLSVLYTVALCCEMLNQLYLSKR